MRFPENIFIPLTVEIYTTSKVFNVAGAKCVVEEICRYAGSAIGSAVVRWPAQYALNAAPALGQTVRLQIGNTVIFRGPVVQAPYEISMDSDELTLILADDKFWLNRNVLGQPGIGTLEDTDQGFTDVGLDLVINANGRPNKSASELDFCTGTAAVDWTCKTALQWLFENYIDADVATLDPAVLSTNWDAKPSNLNLVGQTALQAMDSIAQWVGESWGLKYVADNPAAAPAFQPVQSGAGTLRKVKLSPPRGRATVVSADDWSAASVKVGQSLQDVADVVHAVSKPAIKETTLSTDDILIAATPHDKKFAAGFTVDVTKYADKALGVNLSAGSKPKPWRNRLVTRTSGTAYLTAANLSANLRLEDDADAVNKPAVWVKDGSDWKLCKSGFELDLEKCVIWLEAKVKVFESDGTTTALQPTWASTAVRITVTTELETTRQAFVSWGTPLTKSVHQVIRKNDLLPELRQASILPDLTSSNPNAVVTLAPASEEDYVDLTARLLAPCTQAGIGAAQMETPVEIALPFFPQCNIGDRVNIVGRESPASGDEVIVEIVYRINESYETHIKATNVLAVVKPEKFERPI